MALAHVPTVIRSLVIGLGMEELRCALPPLRCVGARALRGGGRGFPTVAVAGAAVAGAAGPVAARPEP